MAALGTVRAPPLGALALGTAALAALAGLRAAMEAHLAAQSGHQHDSSAGDYDTSASGSHLRQAFASSTSASKLTSTSASTSSSSSSLRNYSDGHDSRVAPSDLSVANSLLVGLLVCIIVVSVVGNTLVCVAIFTERKLRKLGNVFIVSLAIADLFVSCLVMTFALCNELMAYWPFGKWFCDVWIGFDIMCSTASILNLCAISLDRFVLIKDCLLYNRWMTRKVALTGLVMVWFISALVSFLPITLGWHKPNYQSLEEPLDSRLATSGRPNFSVNPNNLQLLTSTSTSTAGDSDYPGELSLEWASEGPSTTAKSTIFRIFNSNTKVAQEFVRQRSTSTPDTQNIQLDPTNRASTRDRRQVASSRHQTQQSYTVTSSSSTSSSTLRNIDSRYPAIPEKKFTTLPAASFEQNYDNDDNEDDYRYRADQYQDQDQDYQGDRVDDDETIFGSIESADGRLKSSTGPSSNLKQSLGHLDSVRFMISSSRGRKDKVSRATGEHLASRGSARHRKWPKNDNGNNDNLGSSGARLSRLKLHQQPSTSEDQTSSSRDQDYLMLDDDLDGMSSSSPQLQHTRLGRSLDDSEEPDYGLATTGPQSSQPKPKTNPNPNPGAPGRTNNRVSAESEEPLPQCMMTLTPTYAVVSSTISFYIPCMIMIGLYTKLFACARRHVRNIQSTCLLPAPIATPPAAAQAKAQASVSAAGVEQSRVNSTPGENHKSPTLESVHLLPQTQSQPPDGSPSRPPAQGLAPSKLQQQHHGHLASHKAAITLGIIMGTFLVCWVPFFCLNIIKAFCVDCIPSNVFMTFTWLGYANSALNPIIYGIHNSEFRCAFNRLFFKYLSIKSGREYINRRLSSVLQDVRARDQHHHHQRQATCHRNSPPEVTAQLQQIPLKRQATNQQQVQLELEPATQHSSPR